MNQVWGGVVTILMAIIGVAILSVILSRNSNTVGVLMGGSQAFSGALGTAMSPVTGGGLTMGIPGGFGSGYNFGMSMGGMGGW